MFEALWIAPSWNSSAIIRRWRKNTVGSWKGELHTLTLILLM